MNTRHFLLLTGLICALWLALFADKTPANGIVESVNTKASSRIQAPPSAPKSSQTVASGRTTSKTEENITLLRLKIRANLIGNQDFKRQTIDLFASNNWTPPPPSAPKPPPPPPPAAPPLPFTFIGKKLEDGAWEIYLSKNDQVIVAKQNMNVDGIYRIDHIAPPSMSIVYLPLNQVQTLSIGIAE